MRFCFIILDICLFLLQDDLSGDYRDVLVTLASY